jgi:glycosyltransferase involved in cell wall biosynthesis
MGFAALWDPEPRTTWSGTPWHLREALARRCDVIDLGVQLPPALRTVLKLIHARPGPTGITTSWSYSALTDRIVQARIERADSYQDVDVILQVQDLADLARPSYTYQDMSFGALDRLTSAGEPLTHFPALSARNIGKRRRRQEAIYERASGVITMSGWLAEQIRLDGVDAGKIHVVHPGINSPIGTEPSLGDDPSPRGPFRDESEPRTLLFLGRDFMTKGGDLVVHAFPLVRQRFRTDTRLVIAGPPRWPLPDPPPEGVTFLGPVPAASVSRLLHDCDLFVMPSRFEGFGIVFAEALVAGRPCIGRRSFAMPEIIQHGVNGHLIDRGGASELADAIIDTLIDEQLYDSVWQQREAASRYWSWDRAASQIIAAIG